MTKRVAIVGVPTSNQDATGSFRDAIAASIGLDRGDVLLFPADAKPIEVGGEAIPKVGKRLDPSGVRLIICDSVSDSNRSKYAKLESLTSKGLVLDTGHESPDDLSNLSDEDDLRAWLDSGTLPEDDGPDLDDLLGGDDNDDDDDKGDLEPESEADSESESDHGTESESDQETSTPAPAVAVADMGSEKDGKVEIAEWTSEGDTPEVQDEDSSSGVEEPKPVSPEEGDPAQTRRRRRRGPVEPVVTTPDEIESDGAEPDKEVERASAVDPEPVKRVEPDRVERRPSPSSEDDQDELSPDDPFAQPSAPETPTRSVQTPPAPSPDPEQVVEDSPRPNRRRSRTPVNPSEQYRDSSPAPVMGDIDDVERFEEPDVIHRPNIRPDAPRRREPSTPLDDDGSISISDGDQGTRGDYISRLPPEDREAQRMIRRNRHMNGSWSERDLSPSKKKANVILVTGSNGGVGKSTCSWMFANTLAKSMSDSGRSAPVWLIETDYKNPKLQERLDIEDDQRNLGNVAEYIARLAKGSVKTVRRSDLRRLIEQNKVTVEETGLQVLVCPYDITRVQRQHIEFALIKALELVSEDGGYIFLDSGTMTAKNYDKVDFNIASRFVSKALVVSDPAHYSDYMRTCWMLTNQVRVSKSNIYVMLNKAVPKKVSDLKTRTSPYKLVGFFPSVQELDPSNSHENSRAWIGDASPKVINALRGNSGHALLEMGVREMEEWLESRVSIGDTGRGVLSRLLSQLTGG